MNPTLVLEFHVHSKRSFDSNVSIDKYIKYLNANLQKNEYAVLGITDHNVIPIKCAEAFQLSTEKVIVIPGIEWRLEKSLKQSISKLCTRRDLITIGPHDDLESYIKFKTPHKISRKGEILTFIQEKELLDYLSLNKKVILIVPHPRHFFFEFYGVQEIEELEQKLKTRKIPVLFFIEDKTGNDPFTRIHDKYQNKYLTLGGQDAHKIYNFLKSSALFTIKTTLPCDDDLIEKWQKAILRKDTHSYLQIINQVFRLMEINNKKIVITKDNLGSVLQFLLSIPSWFKRRLQDFPKNLLK